MELLLLANKKLASYGLLLEIIAKEVNMVPDELIGNLGDVHLYSNRNYRLIQTFLFYGQ